MKLRRLLCVIICLVVLTVLAVPVSLPVLAVDESVPDCVDDEIPAFVPGFFHDGVRCFGHGKNGQQNQKQSGDWRGGDFAEKCGRGHKGCPARSESGSDAFHPVRRLHLLCTDKV